MKLYQPGTKEFNTNGLGTIKDIIGRPEVRQKLNGFFDLVIEVSVLERLYDHIENEAIVVADTPKGPQPFIIYTTEPGLKSKKVYARHLLQRWLERDFVEDTNIVGKTGVNALAQLLEKSVVDNSWISVKGDNSTINSSRLVRKNLLEALIGSENNSIINRFGGELDYQYPSIIYNQEIGQNNGVTVKHRKNLNGYTAKIDTSNLVTRIMPQGFDGLFLPEKYIKSNLEDALGFISIQKVEFSDIKANTSEYAQEDGLPLEEAYEALRTRSQNLLNELSHPKVQIDVDFIDLAKTEQYAQFENLERVNLGDYVQFIHDDFNIELQVTEYTYNPLLHRMTQVTLGEVETSFMLAFRTITKVNQEINLLRDAQPNILKAAKDSATNLIASGFGGFVKYYPDRILIMDTEDEASAKNVWQWNKNGLGFSSTGVAGPYGLAMTSDGQIVADFITTGGLSANRIVSGLLQSADGGTWINMDNGSFSFGNGALKFDEVNGFSLTLSNETRELLKGDKGEKGDKGDKGDDGLDGKDGVDGKDGQNGLNNYELAKLQGYEGSLAEWLETQIGPQGPAGLDGKSYRIIGTLASEEELPLSDNTEGDSYVILGDLHYWNGTEWVNIGRIKGEDGIGYQLILTGRSGLVFDANTTGTHYLDATVYLNNQDVTADIPASNFLWTRQSNKPEEDRLFNTQGRRGKTLALTYDELATPATYNCRLDITDVTEKLKDINGEDILTYTGEAIQVSAGNLTFHQQITVTRDVLDEISDTRTSISALQDEIVLRVEKSQFNGNNIINYINLSPEGAVIKANKIQLEGTITASGNVQITEEGDIVVRNGTFSGEITGENTVIDGLIKLKSDFIYADGRSPSQVYVEFANRLIGRNESTNPSKGLGMWQGNAKVFGIDFLETDATFGTDTLSNETFKGAHLWSKTNLRLNANAISLRSTNFDVGEHAANGKRFAIRSSTGGVIEFNSSSSGTSIGSYMKILPSSISLSSSSISIDGNTNFANNITAAKVNNLEIINYSGGSIGLKTPDGTTLVIGAKKTYVV